MRESPAYNSSRETTQRARAGSAISLLAYEKLKHREVPSQSWQEAEPQELPTLDSAGMSRFWNSNVWSVFILNLFASPSSWVPLFMLLDFAYHLSLQSDSNTHLLLRIYKSELDICFRRARSLLRPILSPVPDSFTSILPASRFPVASTLGSLP